MNRKTKFLVCAILVIACVGIVQATTPVASFTASTTEGFDPITVQFTDTSVGSPTNWEWQFGDGTSNSVERNPSHTFKNFGVYPVNLTVSNTDGSSTSKNVEIFVKPSFIRNIQTPIIPVNSALYPYEGTNLGDPIVFNTGQSLVMVYGGYTRAGGTINLATSPIEYPPHNWTRYSGNPVLRGSNSGWEGDVLRFNSIVKLPNGIYYLYYGSGTGTYMTQIGLATSTDLIHWTKYSGNPIMSASGDEVDTESIWVNYEDGIFRGYYGYQKPYTEMHGVRYAESTDGIHWTKYQDVDVYHTGNPGEIDSYQVEHHQVFKKDGYYWMIAEVGDGTYWRESLSRNKNYNGTFTKMGSIFGGSGSGWDSLSTATPFMFQTPGTNQWNIMYQGANQPGFANTWQIGIASTEPSIDPPVTPTPTPTITIPTTLPTTVITTTPTGTPESTPTKTNCAKGKCKPTRSTGIVGFIMQIFNFKE